MDWRRKMKFGIHSGRTLRKRPTRKYSFIKTMNNCQQFAVVKELHLGEQHLEQDRQGNYIAGNEFEFDDGIPLTGESFHNFHRGYPNDPVIHSLNKRKRWLLPDLVREGVETRYETETKEISDPVGKDPSEKLRITVIERHVSPYNFAYFGRGHADCFSVTSNCPATESSPVRKPTKGYAHVGDLNNKRMSGQAELYYEFLSPYPNNCWPDHQNVPSCHESRHRSKSKKKSKGRRNKKHRYGVTQDEPTDCTLYHDSLDVDHANNIDKHMTWCNASSYKPDSAFSFPIGACIEAAIHTKASSDNIYLPAGANICSQKPCSTAPSYQFGKGDAIYLESDDERLGLLFSPGKREELPEECLSEDRKYSIQLLAESIHPDNLKHEFGEDYCEDAILPRKFIIKSDLNKTMPNMFTNDCCLLFEVSDTACASAVVVEVQVTLLLPINEILSEKVSESVELELSNIKCSGPMPIIRDVINLIIEKIVHECNCCSPKSSCLRRNPSNARQACVNFIHDICQQKPEICLSKQAVQYSTTDVATTFCQQQVSGDVKTNESLCEICLLDMDKDKGVTTTCSLQCFHGFCNACWKHYIMICIQAGQSRILCPIFNCNTSVGEALVWSSTNSKLYQMYCKVNHQLAIDTNPALRPCPTPDCAHLAYIPPTEKKVSKSIPVLCHCGQLWCFACQNDAHWPASCEEAEVFRKSRDYFEDLVKISAMKERITSVQVKRCPFCSYPIDKGMGCPHMSCRCGNEFCWDCLKPWFSHDRVLHECKGPVEQLEEVQLAINFGNARYNKYCNVSFHNFVARSRKYLKVVRKVVENAKMVENSYSLVSGGAKTAASYSCVARSYVESRVSSHVETMFHFKYLAHFVMENTAASAAVSKRKTMVKPLDEKFQNMTFIIGRIDELILKPTMLTDERNVAKMKMFLKNGEQLIKSMHSLVKWNRKN